MIRAERHIETEKEVCGELTVFLSLILTCICALMGGLFESARAAGSGWYMQMALNSSLDSLMSCYHREIWDKYRIFVLECADKERLAAEMEPQMETYLAAAPFYPVSGGKVQIEAMDAITGHNGDFFAKEVTDYMKVGVWTLESEESELPEMEKRMTDIRKMAEKCCVWKSRSRRSEPACKNRRNIWRRWRQRSARRMEARSFNRRKA